MKCISPRRWVVALAAIGLALTAQPAKAGYLNLTASGSSGSFATDSSGGTAIFTQGSVGSGTGVFPAFVQLQAQGQANTVQGYNTTANNVFATASSDQHNHELLFSSLAVVTVNGNDYFQFSLDINENRNDTDRYLSLDALQIYTSGTPNQSTTNVSTLGTLKYDIGASNGVLLDFFLEAGSGKADMTVLIPVFQLGAGEQFVYLYSAFGAVGTNPPAGAPPGDYGTSDGFEEWGAKLGGGGGGGSVVPAPAGLILLASAVPVLAFRRLIRRKPSAA
jgi:hypothetical protein